ncbi:hypothetical protein [Caniella muris]|uniref:hypothetical protein n=1 Tax=Caniella muris TaxID=2941502 RepID=UPI00203CBBC3|nr:hypothetical protein [Caniella muris]
MADKADIEFLMVDSTGANDEAVAAALRWLAEQGGGSVVAPDKRTLQSTLGAPTDAAFERLERRLSGMGITLAWKRRGLPFRAQHVVALYMDKTIDDVVQNGCVEKLLIIPWTQDELDWFKTAYDFVIVVVADGGGIDAADTQPETQSVEELVPEELDKILRILAQVTAGYDGHLQWREIERFKAELMNYSNEWMRLDSDVVFRRCIELEMSATVSEAVRGMVKRLHEGHRFRPKRGYEDGWRR